jgi:dephospho-CoA kinase
MMNLRIIGVTGGIGSGKSTVSLVLRDLGAAVIDADSVARAITVKGGKALEELISYFGNGILDSNGELNRKTLADIVFNDQVKLHALNAITHKHIIMRIKDSIESIKSSGKNDVIVLDAPIPLENGFIDLVDEVWVVASDRDIRIKRVMDRSGLTYDEILSRINAQIKDEEYLKSADEVIYNNGSIEELEKTAVKLFIQKRQDRQK